MVEEARKLPSVFFKRTLIPLMRVPLLNTITMAFEYMNVKWGYKHSLYRTVLNVGFIIIGV